ncbi:hypothetical protein [Nocardioides conyzicola]|uniref:Uncharacterized protein n=1 Tax=Nocardioides conyzicola TaxID=1651781 RepID=A0ABP8WL43_9ACTN
MSHGVRLAAACLLAAAASVVPLSGAEAATCSTGDGVSVVVDFHELGGGVQTACIADGGGKAASTLFEAGGFDLSYVQRQPGFVCQVDAKPSSSCVNTPPADAYWGLWWSDGTSGQWTYATRGAGSQTVPDGGYVAFSWNGSSSRSAPGVSPAAHHAAPTPTSKPTTRPSVRPTHHASAAPTKKPSSTTSAAPSESSGTPTSPSPSVTTLAPGKVGQPTKSPGGVDGEMLPESTSTSTTPSPLTSTAADPADPADPADGGLPTWVGPVVVVGLFAAGGAVAVVRRRRNPSP